MCSQTPSLFEFQSHTVLEHVKYLPMRQVVPLTGVLFLLLA